MAGWDCLSFGGGGMFGWVSVVPFSFIPHWGWFWADKVTRCICLSLASLIMAFPIVWFMSAIQTRIVIAGPLASALEAGEEEEEEK